MENITDVLRALLRFYLRERLGDPLGIRIVVQQGYVDVIMSERFRVRL